MEDTQINCSVWSISVDDSRTRQICRSSLAIEEVTILLLVALSFWVLISLIVYYRKYSKLCKSYDANQEDSKTLLKLAITITSVISINAILYQTTFVIEIATSQILNSACDIPIKIQSVINITCFLLIYFFLWFRLNLLYNQPLLRRFKTKLITIVIKLIIFIIVGGYITYIALNVFQQSYISSNFGCVVCNKTKRSTTIFIVAITIKSVILLSQLVLFCHPIREYKRHMSGITETSTNKSEWIEAVLRKTSISYLGCLVVDVISAIITDVLIPSHLPRGVVTSVHRIILLANLFLVILCFEDHKKIYLGSWRFKD